MVSKAMEKEGMNVPGGGCRVRHTGSQASLSFACQARASGLLLDPGKNIGNSGFGSAPGDTRQFLPILTPAVSAGGLFLNSQGSQA